MSHDKSSLIKSVHRPKLVVFDLDGTAIQSNINARMSAALVSAINEATSNGLNISIATGRSWEHFAAIINNIRRDLAPCIISGGSQIVDTVNSSILWEKQLSRKEIKALNLIADKHNKALSYNNMLSTYGPVNKIPSVDHATIVYLLDIRSTELETIHNEVSAIDGLHSAITHAWDDTGLYALHVTSNVANKGTALHKLIEMVNISTHEVIAIGDGFNDIPMFEVAATSYAIAGSVVDGHETTAGSIPTVNNDGLANFIRKLYYKDSL